MPPCPPSLGLGLGLPFVRGGGASLDPDSSDVIWFNGTALWFNGTPILFTNA
jgi:hypothetical protein